MKDFRDLGLGDRVKHETLGYGTVVKCHENGTQVNVKFDKGIRAFDQRIANVLQEA